MNDVATVNANEILVRAGKYLTFSLGEEQYGLEILKVREIIGMMEVTTVPQTPSYVRGVINLRGKVIPVVDLRTRFDLPAVEQTEQTCIIVVYFGDTEIGVLVDRVEEVLDIPGDEIEDAPAFGSAVDTSFLLGMSKARNRVTILLDITRVLSGAEEMTAAV